MSKLRHDRRILILGLIALVLVILNASVWYSRLDFTRNKAYTISDVSISLMRGLNDPAEIDYYVSAKLQKQEPLIQNIVDIVYEYGRLSNGKVVVKLVDTDALSADEVAAKGLQPQLYTIKEQNQRTQARVFSGIIIRYVDRTKILPWVTNLGTLEYDVTMALTQLSTQKTPTIGLLVPPAKSQDDMATNFTLLTKALSESSTVKPLTAGQEIPSDINALFIFGDQNLSDADVYHIDQAIMNGVGVLIGIDTVGTTITQGIQAVPLQKSKLRDALETWGVEVKDGWVLDQSSRQIVITVNNGSFNTQQFYPYPLWVHVPEQGLNPDAIISARSSGLDLLWASPVSLKKDAEGQVLAQSTNTSWVMTNSPTADPQYVGSIFQSYKDKRASENLAVLRTGKIASAFTGKDLSKTLPGVNTGGFKSSTDKGRVIVVGDADFASDYNNYLGQVFNSVDNLSFLQNSGEWLTGSEDLLKLRTRESHDQALSKITDPATKDAAANMVWILNVVAIPLALIAVGVVRGIRRKSARDKSLQEQAE